MKSMLQELNNPHPGVGTEVELMLYRILTLITTILSLLVVIPSNFLQHLPVQVNAATAILGVAAAFLHLLSRRKRMYQTVLFFLILITLNYIWYFNAGSTGSVTYYFFAEIIYLVFFFRGWKRVLFMSLVLANVTLLMLSELWNPALLVPFLSQGDRMADQIVGFLTSGIACCVLLWVLVSTYDGEHERRRLLNSELAEVLEINLQKTAELEKSIAEIKTLRGFLPICANCKKIRDDYGLWTRVEEYISKHTEAEFSHGLCPDCFNLEIEHLNALEKQSGSNA
ncbi:MAG TPA: hypothetical protein VN652_06990 [Geobacteraceae bacterium]|nr:hypothetical protein [Geobacteraceae bacterium]